MKAILLLVFFQNIFELILIFAALFLSAIVKVYFYKSEEKIMSKYVVTLNEEDLQMIKDCHSKNPSIMKAMNEAKKVED